jgi:hypothetical protein
MKSPKALDTNGIMTYREFVLDKVKVIQIDNHKREIRLVVHTHFTPDDIKINPLALAAVEHQRDVACRYLTVEGFLEPCTSSDEWCVRTGGNPYQTLMTKAESIAYLRRLQALEKLAEEKDLEAPTEGIEVAFRELENTAPADLTTQES